MSASPHACLSARLTPVLAPSCPADAESATMRNDPRSLRSAPRRGPDTRCATRASTFVGRANRWMISGAVILAGGVSLITAHAFHAHAAGSSAAQRSDRRLTDAGRRPAVGRRRQQRTASVSVAGTVGGARGSSAGRFRRLLTPAVVMLISSAVSPSPFWFLTRGTGAIALVLLTRHASRSGVANVRRMRIGDDAAVRARGGAPQRVAARGRLRDRPHRDGAARRFRADQAARRGDPVHLRLPAGVARAGRGRVRSTARGHDHEPRSGAGWATARGARPTGSPTRAGRSRSSTVSARAATPRPTGCCC